MYHNLFSFRKALQLFSDFIDAQKQAIEDKEKEDKAILKLEKEEAKKAAKEAK